MVRESILAHGDAAVGSNYLYVLTGLGNAQADLIVAAAGGKDGKGAGENGLAGGKICCKNSPLAF